MMRAPGASSPLAARALVDPVRTIPLVAPLPGIPLGKVVEVCGSAGTAFAALVAGRTHGPVLWILPHRALDHPYAHGLSRFLDPNRLYFVWTSCPQETLWATEEALRSGGAGAVIAELPTAPTLTQSRRFQLAATQGAGASLLLCPDHHHATAAAMRWQCDPVLTPPSPIKGPIGDDWGSTFWGWTLKKNKMGTMTSPTMGPQGGWQVGWDAKTRTLNLVSPAGGRSMGAPQGA